MTVTIGGSDATRQVYFHDAAAPPATAIRPSAFVAVRWSGGRLLLVRRSDSGAWEFPGGCVEVGETVAEAAVRKTFEEAGVHVLVTGIVGLFTDPRYVIRSPGGEVRQQFAVLFRARALGGVPHPDLREASAASWVAMADLPGLRIDPPVREWVAEALANESAPYIG
jgi:8-oxo-dGTP diphosphatase